MRLNRFRASDNHISSNPKKNSHLFIVSRESRSHILLSATAFQLSILTASWSRRWVVSQFPDGFLDRVHFVPNMSSGYSWCALRIRSFDFFSHVVSRYTDSSSKNQSVFAHSFSTLPVHYYSIDVVWDSVDCCCTFILNFSEWVEVMWIWPPDNSWSPPTEIAKKATREVLTLADSF
jgi:hypothetical protein